MTCRREEAEHRGAFMRAMREPRPLFRIHGARHGDAVEVTHVVRAVDEWPVPAGAPVPFHASAQLSSSQHVPDDGAYRWALDGREVARGRALRIDAPPEGEHDPTLTVTWAGEDTVAPAPARRAAGGQPPAASAREDARCASAARIRARW